MGALEAGRRLRAKANLAEPVARKLALDLEAMGAIVAVSPHKASTGLGTVPPAGAPGHAPVPPRLVSASPIAPEQVVTFSTFSSTTPSLTLATLDGEDADTSLPELSAAAAPVERTPIPGPASSASSARPSAARDAFRPPADDAAPLELVARPARSGKIAPMPSINSVKVMSPTVEARAVSAARPALSGPEVSIDAGAPEPPPPEPPPRGLVGLATRDARGRLVAGLLIGLILGFVPAHIYASYAEDKLDDIGATLAREPAPQNDVDHALLMQQYDLAQARIGRVRTRIMVVTAVVWLLAGAASAAGYWRLTSRE